jgi:hypothetical protein
MPKNTLEEQNIVLIVGIATLYYLNVLGHFDFRNRHTACSIPAERRHGRNRRQLLKTTENVHKQTRRKQGKKKISLTA